MERIVLNGKSRRFWRMLTVLLALAWVLTAAGPLEASEDPLISTDQTAAAQSTASEADADETPEEDAFMQDLLNESTGGDVPAAADVDTEPALPLSYEGEVMGSLWAPNNHDEEWHTTNRLDLKGWKEFGALSVDGRLRLDYQDLEGEDKARADLRELYATYQLRPGDGRYADFSLGKKILYWGKGDEVRPLDRICPEDLTALYFNDLNDRKTGRVGAFVDWQASRRIRFEGFWSPYFEAGESPELGDYYEPSKLRMLADAGIAIDDADEPDEWSSDAGFGGRLMFSVLKADLALYGFQGYDPKPTYEVHRIGIHPLTGLPIVPQSVRETHPRMTLYGADIERAFGSVVLRAEAAYQSDGAWFSLDWAQDPTLLLETPSGTVEKDQLQYVIGMDKQDLFIHNLFMNLQFVGTRIFDYDSRIIVPESNNGVTAYLRYSFLDSKFEVWYRYMILFEETEQRHHFEIGYKPLPWAKVSLGAIAFDGDADAYYFGQYADRDFVYTKLKLIF
ncbi:DUF1302 family protein [uncultured Desulfosarcina sp.]|uniref:DUF1302 family protein n=1 Tax=uncultured Desulfosarcina sp. TaxID=218289 RepID=UPI0029C84691|nr:DUF1302 family protein [uncultured Desulfosarcina sp.]